MIDKILVRLFASEWRIILIVSLLLLALAETGFQVAQRRHRETTDAHRSQVTGIQTAVLGLLALLLGFTFAMALGRYGLRPEFGLAGGERHRHHLSARLVSARNAHKRSGRLAAAQCPITTSIVRGRHQSGNLRSLEDQCSALQRELWTHAVAAGREAPSPLTVAFVNSLNDLIDVDAARLHALRSHVPGAAWLLVLTVSAVGCYRTRYAAGISKVRTAFSTILLPLLLP
jgi:hypothetical protein